MGTPLYNTDIIPLTSRPTLTVMDDGDYFVILDTSTGKISKILRTNIQKALNISYDNTASELTAETVQAALDELVVNLGSSDSAILALSGRLDTLKGTGWAGQTVKGNADDIDDLQNDKLDKIPEAGASIGTAQNPYSKGYFENVVVNNEGHFENVVATEFIKTGTIEASKHSYGVAVSGTVTFTRASNTISLAGITANLGLEVGDVIQVSGTSNNNNLYTVETASTDSIVVNYEHRNGEGSLSLTDETKACTIRRIAKWYNAPLGVGQAVVRVRSSTATGNFLYTAPPNRAMISMARMSGNDNTSRRYDVYVNGILVQTICDPGGWGNGNTSVLVPIGGNVEYRVTATNTNTFIVSLVR